MGIFALDATGGSTPILETSGGDVVHGYREAMGRSVWQLTLPRINLQYHGKPMLDDIDWTLVMKVLKVAYHVILAILTIIGR